MGDDIEPTIDSLLDILDQKYPRPGPEIDRDIDEISTTITASARTTEVSAWQDIGNISAAFGSEVTTELLPDLDTLNDESTDEWETISIPMTTVELDAGDIITLYYGFIIAILVLAIIVMVIVIFLCCERLNKPRRRVVFAGAGDPAPSAVVSGATARREVFESLANRDLNETQPTLCRISPRDVEEIPMRDIASSSTRDIRPHVDNSRTESRGFPEPPLLARVYSANKWTPDYNGNLIRVTGAHSSSANTGRSTSRLSRGRGSTSTRRYSRRSYTVPFPAQPTRRPSRRVSLPKYNLSGETIVTPSEPSFVRELQRRSSETEVMNLRRGNESSLIVPTNSPNCSSENSDNSGSVFLPGDGGEGPVAPDSDFGASAGVSQCNVSSNTSMRGVGESLASASYVWDGYDPSFRRRQLSYVDGAYYPVLGERQYWV